jgi:hypothetical protein
MTTRVFFLQLNPCGYSPHVTFSVMKVWVCLLSVGLDLVKYTFRTYSMLSKILPCALHMSSVSAGFEKQVTLKRELNVNNA